MEELKECPYCGKRVAVLSNAKELEYCKHFDDEACECFEDVDSKYQPCTLWTVVCNYHDGGCGASSGWFTDKEKAIKRWNTRGESWR